MGNQNIINFRKWGNEKARALFYEADRYTDKFEDELRRYEMKAANGCQGTDQDIRRLVKALDGLIESDRMYDKGIRYMRINNMEKAKKL